jgi:hypothetical protein
VRWGDMDWIDLALNRDGWWALVNAVMKFKLIYFAFCLMCFGLTYSPPSRGYVYNLTNGDCLLKCRLCMGQDGKEVLLHPGKYTDCPSEPYMPGVLCPNSNVEIKQCEHFVISKFGSTANQTSIIFGTTADNDT